MWVGGVVVREVEVPEVGKGQITRGLEATVRNPCSLP